MIETIKDAAICGMISSVVALATWHAAKFIGNKWRKKK